MKEEIYGVSLRFSIIITQIVVLVTVIKNKGKWLYGVGVLMDSFWDMMICHLKNVRSYCSGAEHEVWAKYFLVSVCK